MAEDATVGGPAEGGRLELGVLGPLTVTIASRPFVPRRRLRELVAWLALLEAEGSSTERLAELVWGREAPLHPGRELQVLLQQLRRSVGTAAVAVSGGRVGLNPGLVDVDADRFTTLLCGSASGHARAVREQALQTALALWRGSPYPEIAEHPDAMGQVRRLEHLRLLAVAELALLRLAGNAPPCDVVADVYPALAEDADGEVLRAVMAVGLALAARRVEALRALGDLEPDNAAQRAWRAATEQAVRLDDAAALSGQVQQLHATIRAAWPPLPARTRAGVPADDGG